MKTTPIRRRRPEFPGTNRRTIWGMPSDCPIFSNFQSIFVYFPEVMSTNSVHEPMDRSLWKKIMHLGTNHESFAQKIYGHICPRTFLSTNGSWRNVRERHECVLRHHYFPPVWDPIQASIRLLPIECLIKHFICKQRSKSGTGAVRSEFHKFFDLGVSGQATKSILSAQSPEFAKLPVSIRNVRA